MKHVLVGVFNSAGHAHEAHATLLDQGFRNGQVGVDAGASRPAGKELEGLAGMIARMFSGFLTDGDPLARAYHDTLSRGGGIVALHDLDESEEARARAIMSRHGAASVRTLTPLADRGRTRPGSATRPGGELAAVAALGPRAYVLPNAPDKR